MYQLKGCLEFNHNEAGSMNATLTEVFLTPDGVKVQVYGEMTVRAGKSYPEFKLAKIKDK